VIPAAGLGSRFLGDGHKLVQQVDGHAVLEHTLRNAKASGLPVLLVTTAPIAEQARAVIDLRHIVVLPAVGEAGIAHGATTGSPGMGTSIAAGVAARPDASGWLILPGDMPLVRADTLHAVALALTRHAVVQACHGGERGHPVGFSAEHSDALLALDGDEGARRIVARQGAFLCEVDDPGVRVDIDTLDDLARLRSHFASG